MSKISGRQALFAGFGVIRREPAAFLVWCVVCFLLGIAPQMLSFGTMLQSLSAISAGGDALGPEMMAAQQQAMRFAPLTYLCSFALMLLVPPAVFRATLAPEDRGFLYLRVGAGELWFLIVAIVFFIAYFVAMVVTMIPFFIVVGLGSFLAQQGGVGAIIMIPILLIVPIALFVGLIWFLLRFSMAPVMAFAERTFRFTESWALTRGATWKMFVVTVGVFVLTTVAYVLILSLVIVGAGVNLAALGANLTQDPGSVVAAVGLPWLAVGLVALAVLTAGHYVIWGAAWADIYRQLRPRLAETFD